MAAQSTRLAARAFGLCLLITCLAGCASKDSTTYDKRDPFEPVNRVVFNINDVADRIVFRQAAYTYELFVPSLARRGVNNFFSNLVRSWKFSSSDFNLFAFANKATTDTSGFTRKLT